MKKYKLLRFGHCYLNKEGDFVIALLSGDKKHGYQFAANHAQPQIFLGQIQMLSRIVPNDGNWIEIDESMFNAVSFCHSKAYKVKIDGNGHPIITHV